MSIEAKDNQIVRAWFLVNASTENLEELANQIREEANESLNDSEKSFITRADLTDGPFNIIMAVSAEDDGFLSRIHEIVVSYKEVQQIEVARVLTHVPYPPHKSPGFVTEAEANPLNGLQGENAWG
jgi:hypothetical protein